MRQEAISTSFETSPDLIDQADVLHILKNGDEITNSVKSGREGWTCAWASDGSYFAWSAGLRILHLIPWDGTKQKRKSKSCSSNPDDRKYHIIDCGENVWSVAFGSGLPHKASHIYRQCCVNKNLVIAVGLSSGRIKLFNCDTGSVIVELLDHKETVRSLDFSKDGSLQLVSGSRDATIKMWDLNNEGNMYCTHKLKGKVNSCRYSPNGKYVAAVGTNRMVLLWQGDLADNSVTKLDGHVNEVLSVDFSPDSTFMATASFDTRVIIWNTQSAQKLKRLGHLHPSPSFIFAGGANNNFVRSVCFSRDGATLGTVCDDGYVRFWEWESCGDPVSVLEVTDPLTCRFSPDGQVLAVGTRCGECYMVAAPTPVTSLLQLSRVAVRKNLSQVDDSSELPIPLLLKHYLTVAHLKQ